MEYNEVVTRIAPCGLDCSRCADKSNGEIQQTCVKLSSLLNGYLRVAKLREASRNYEAPFLPQNKARYLVCPPPNWVLLVYLIAGLWLFNRQVLREEASLKKIYGQKYAEYCKKVRRYL